MQQLKMSIFKQRTGLSEIPKWADSKILSDKQIKDKEYYFYNNTEEIDVEIDKIKYTAHCDYNNKTWFNAVTSLKRYSIKDSNIAKQALLFPENKGDNVLLEKYGDDFVIVLGNHRCILANFSDLKSFNAKVNIFIFNENLYKKHQEVRCLVKAENLQIEGEKIVIHKNNTYKSVIISFDNFEQFTEFYNLFKTKVTFLQKLKFYLWGYNEENLFSWFYFKKMHPKQFEFQMYSLKTKLLDIIT